MTSGPPPGLGGWLRRCRAGGPSPSARLLCFHHAGGAAAVFRDWGRLLPPHVEPLAIQLPGRADRRREPAFSRMEALLDALIPAVAPVLDLPYACYGLSMGAKVSWALTHRLQRAGLRLPRALYLSGAAAPDVREGRSDWSDSSVSDEELVGYLREMQGTPPEVLEHPEFLDALLPTLRADLTLVDGFVVDSAPPLDLPIHAFAGIRDAEGGPERMRGWGQFTRAAFTLKEIDAGHFFDAEGEARIAAAVAAGLAGPSVPARAPTHP